MFEALIRVGGSLIEEDQLPNFCLELSNLGARHRLLVVPGGGLFADAVRVVDQRYALGAAAAHWMAILAMDQYGYLLSDLIPGGCTVRNLEEARQALEAGSVPILLPFSLLRTVDPLPHGWEVTSDSIAAWIARQGKIPRLVLVKDVDGLYATDPRMDECAELKPVVTLDEMGHCAGVDARLATVLTGSGLHVWVVNGNEPGRLTELLEHGRTRGTYCHARAI